MFSTEVSEKAANWWCIKIIDNMAYYERELISTTNEVTSALSYSDSVPGYLDWVYRCQCGHEVGYAKIRKVCPCCHTKVCNMFESLTNAHYTVLDLSHFKNALITSLITYDDNEITFGVNFKPFDILETIVNDLNIPNNILPQKTFMKIVGDEIQIHTKQGPYTILK